MDSRDSFNVVAKEGGSSDAATAEDYGVLSVASSLAKEAAALFQSRKYAECVDLLNQLLQKNPDDLKVLHNIAIAEFFNEGCSNPKKLLEALINVKKKCEDLGHDSREQEDITSQLGNRALSVPKGSNTLSHQMSTLNGETMVFNDEFDTSLATLNTAIILFNLHKYSKAQSILESLFQNIEPIDEGSALHVCLLLLDVTILTQDVSKFVDVMNYLERTFNVGCMINQTENGNMGLQQPSNLVSKYTSVHGSASVSDDLNSEMVGSRSASEDSLSRTLSEEAMEYETLLSTLDTDGQKLSRLANFQLSYDPLRSPDALSSFAIDIKLKLPLYRVQLLLLTRSLKAAKREVKLTMNIARGRDSSRALFLKSQLEYARGNYPKAVKLLVASNNQTEVESSVIFNNYGCIFYQQGKPHTSGIFFQRALSSCSAKSSTIFSQDKSPLIAYNCGVHYLECGNPILAARCFVKASSVFHKRPLSWLRLAECCLMALEKGPLKSSVHVPHRGSELNIHVVGQGKWRYLAMDNGFSRNGHIETNEGVGEIHPSDSDPKLSMLFARQCLSNSLYLLSISHSKHAKPGFPSESCQESELLGQVPSPRNSDHKRPSGRDSKPASKEIMSSGQVNSNGDVKDQRSGTSVSPITGTSFSEYEDIRKRENQMIMQAVLVDLAFVELELGNSLKALSTALSLLQLPECSKMHAFLGHIYAAEALCHLNRPNEAAEHLSVYLTQEDEVELPYTVEDSDEWQRKRTMDTEDPNTASKATPKEPQNVVFLKPEEARGALYVNLAAMFTMQGDLEQANRCVDQALSMTPDSLEAILMAVVLDIKSGDMEGAVSKLRRCSHVTFRPSDVTS
ncbi:hypothetical protein Dimus_034335 [Dionaea muscipula]